MAPDLGQRPLGSVQEARDAVLGSQPGREGRPGGQRVGHGRATEGHERHHVDDAEARVHAVVLAEVEPLDRGCRHRPRGVGASEREHRPVVVGVGVHVEQVGTGGVRELAQRRLVTPFADVEHALEHLRSVAPRAAAMSPSRGRLVRWRP